MGNSLWFVYFIFYHYCSCQQKITGGVAGIFILQLVKNSDK